MFGSVGTTISKSGVVGNVVDAVGSASSSLSIQKRFPLPVGITAIFTSRRRLTSDHVGSVTGRSVVFEKMQVAFGIASLSLSVQKMFLLPVYCPPFCIPVVGRCRARSALANQAWSR